MSDDPIKDVLNLIPYGFYCVTSKADEDVNIMVANWFSQVSFEPRHVVLGLQKTSYTHGLVKVGKVYALNLFLKGDAELIKAFTKSRAKNPQKVENASYTLSPTIGCPIVAGAAAYLECQVVEMVDGGGHSVVIGEVVGAGVLKEGSVVDILTLPDLGWSYAG